MPSCQKDTNVALQPPPDFGIVLPLEERQPRESTLSDKAKPRRWPRRLIWCLAILVLLHVLLILPWRWIDPPTSSFMLRENERYRPLAWTWVPAERISDAARMAVIASEDQRFAEHWGIDFQAIQKAVQDNQVRNRPRGASTLTQQVVKNLYLTSNGGYPRKAVEAWLTLWADALWPKQRTLELYLNLAEFGPGIYGIEAAAQHYFGIPAAQLNTWQASRLATVLPSPKRIDPLSTFGYVPERAGWIRTQMRMLGGTGYLDRL